MSTQVDSPSTFCFSVQATAEPGVMPRVLELFAKRGLVPSTWHSAVRGEELTIDIQMVGLDQSATDYVAACLRQVHGVECVLTSEKRRALAASGGV